MIVLLFLLAGCAMLLSTKSLRASTMHPAYRARFLLIGLVGGAVLVESSLVLWAGPTMLETLGLADWAQLCRRVLGASLVGGPLGGWMAAGAAAWVAIASLAGAAQLLRFQRHCRVEAILGDEQRHGVHDIVVLPSNRLLAYSLGGRRPQIVVSQGLMNVLPAGHVDAIVAHEWAHIRNRHERFLMVASALMASLGKVPTIRLAVEELHLDLERWADEDAALSICDGRRIVRQALMMMTFLGSPRGSFAFGNPATIATRVAALATVSPRRSVRSGLALVMAGAFATLACLAAFGWATHGVVAALIDFGRCCHL